MSHSDLIEIYIATKTASSMGAPVETATRGVPARTPS